MQQDAHWFMNTGSIPTMREAYSTADQLQRSAIFLFLLRECPFSPVMQVLLDEFSDTVTSDIAELEPFIAKELRSPHDLLHDNAELLRAALVESCLKTLKEANDPICPFGLVGYRMLTFSESCLPDEARKLANFEVAFRLQQMAEEGEVPKDVARLAMLHLQVKQGDSAYWTHVSSFELERFSDLSSRDSIVLSTDRLKNKFPLSAQPVVNTVPQGLPWLVDVETASLSAQALVNKVPGGNAFVEWSPKQEPGGVGDLMRILKKLGG